MIVFKFTSPQAKIQDSAKVNSLKETNIKQQMVKSSNLLI